MYEMKIKPHDHYGKGFKKLDDGTSIYYCSEKRTFKIPPPAPSKEKEK